MFNDPTSTAPVIANPGYPFNAVTFAKPSEKKRIAKQKAIYVQHLRLMDEQ